MSPRRQPSGRSSVRSTASPARRTFAGSFVAAGALWSTHWRSAIDSSGCPASVAISSPARSPARSAIEPGVTRSTVAIAFGSIFRPSTAGSGYGKSTSSGIGSLAVR